MLAFILQRLIQAVIVMVTVAFISFLLFNYIGDPVNNLLGETATVAQKQALRASLGLDQPLVLRFLHYLGLAVRGPVVRARRRPCAARARDHERGPDVDEGGVAPDHRAVGAVPARPLGRDVGVARLRAEVPVPQGERSMAFSP